MESTRLTGSTYNPESLLVLMPSFGDLEIAKELLNQIRAFAPPEVQVSGVVIDESLGCDKGWSEDSSDDRRVVLSARYGAQTALALAARNLVISVDFDWLCTMDSDGEDRPEDVWRLWEKRCGYDVVLAVRRSRHATVAFRVFYRIYRILFRILTGKSIRTGNFALMSRSWITRNIWSPMFLLSFAGAIASLDSRSESVRCDRGKRMAGKSRMKLTNSILDGVRFCLPRADRIVSRSLLAFISVSLFLLVILAGVGALGVQDAISPGWITSAITLVSVVVGATFTVFLVSTLLYVQLLLNSKADGITETQ